MAANIPKFASFRPKPKPVPALPEEAQQVRQVDKDPKEKARHDKTQASQPQHHQQPPKLHFSDRRGDADILKYGTVNRYRVPAYRRCGHGFVLGLSTSQKIDRETSTDQEIYITSATQQRQGRLLTAKNLAKQSNRTLRFIKPSDHHQPDQDCDFISFSGTGKRKRDDDDDDDSEDGKTPHPDYRGIDRHDKSSEPIDPDTLYESDVQTTSVGADITRENSKRMRRTREHPEDLEGWLAFIAHQEQMMMLDRSSAELSVTDKRHLADVRIPIYEEALKKVRNDQNSHVRLYEGLLEEASRSWDEARLASKWKDVLARHPYNAELWLRYLDFVQSGFARFKYEDCRTVFLNCLQTLQSSPQGASPETNLHILLRLTSMVHGAGYQELALAIWQAVLEFHLLRPSRNADSTLQDVIQSFEDFWECEIPRIGEPQAKGWRNFDSNDDPPPGPAPLQMTDTSDTVFQDFQKREPEAMLKLRYPGRTSDDVAEDDPFHTIFFSDIQEYLALIPSDTSATLIVEAFLCFCGLPCLPQVAPHQQKWWSDPYLQYTSSSSPSYEDDSSQFVQTLRCFLCCPLKSFQMTSWFLFEQDFSLQGINLSTSFIQQLLKLVAFDSSNDAIIGEYLLAFSSRHFPSDIPKLAKQLLKSRPSNLRLYNAYGLAELRRGNVAKADQVFSMALSMHKGIPTQDSLQLLYNWVWSAIDKDQLSEAFWRLVSPQEPPTQIARTTSPDPTAVLRAHTLFTDTTQQSLIRQDFSTAVLSTSLLTLLKYLSPFTSSPPSHPNLPDTITISTALLHSIPTSHAECLSQTLARLLTHHATHTPIHKASHLRMTLSPLIALFPNNIILLSLFAANEARFSIDDRVRDVMRRPRAEELSVAGWMFAIWYETLRGERGGSTSHSVRALYRRAVGTVGRNSPVVWGSWVKFEVEQLEAEKVKWSDERTRKKRREGNKRGRVDEAEQKVRSTFYEGLGRLPWCKTFVMLAFTIAKGLFSNEEKGRLYRVMLEKEMRLYVEIDEDKAI